MVTDFVYRGIPVYKDGVVVAVRPARSIRDDNGLYYRGVLSHDSSGNDFVYRGTPDNADPPAPHGYHRLADSLGRKMYDSLGRAIYVRG